jgi:hypothetical protein
VGVANSALPESDILSCEPRTGLTMRIKCEHMQIIEAQLARLGEITQNSLGFLPQKLNLRVLSASVK